MNLSKTQMILGGIAVLAIGYYLYKRNAAPKVTVSQNGIKLNANSKASETVDVGKNKGADGRNLTVHK